MPDKLFEKLLLTISGAGIVPIALSYGLMPEKSMPYLYGIESESINLTHIMRAIMGLYIGQAIIWFCGVAWERLRTPALYCLVVFMLGLAAGRILSIFIDGQPHWLLITYMFLELAIGSLGLTLILKKHKSM